MSEPTISDSSQDFSTPMMKQYLEIKKQYPDCLLFFRLGDFYELFMDDAKIGAHVLGITLTGRNKGKDGRIPMCGVPFHAVDSYLSKLVKAGYKIAICEQTSTPDGKGIVTREVVRIVTPGTVLDEKTLEKKENNYLVSISINNNIVGIAACDISTGDFTVAEMKTDNFATTLVDELSKLHPAECILSQKLYENINILKSLKNLKNSNIYCFYDWDIFAENATEILKSQFGVKTLEGFGIGGKIEALKAAAALIGYLKYTQKDRVTHLKSIRVSGSDEFVILDRSTILNLELFSQLRDGDKKGALIFHIDHTITGMGARLLRLWLVHPLRSKEKIDLRLNAVEYFYNFRLIRDEIREKLKEVLDIERILSRLSVGIGSARDLVGLKQSLQKIFEIQQAIQMPNKKELLFDRVPETLHELIKTIDLIIVREPPLDTKIGGMIHQGIHKELDELRSVIGGGKEWLIRLEQQERKRTGINSLKVKFNQVFGFYIEISHTHKDKVPSDYIRKQTLVNAERFITPDLKKQEEIVLSAEEKINAIELQIFTQTVHETLKYSSDIQKAAKIIATIDVLSSFAQLSEKWNYVKPIITKDEQLVIKNGRHPVVEQLLEDAPFVPNDVLLNNTDEQLMMITGPNMGGKSVYIRQIAIIVLMAQMGCFVPASAATISLVDRIFVRSGASDVIAMGLSTFMVEMVETANILNNATSESLIILDEIGRGTSTYDGLSLAWAIAEYLVSHPKVSPKTLFATHYHELQELCQKYPKIKNFQVAVEQKKNDLIFLHKVVPGGTSHSYGIAVAKLAGIPTDVIHRALEVLNKLESQQKETPQHKISISNFEQVSFLAEQKHPVLDELEQLNINQITPLDALKKLASMKEKI